MENQKFKIGDKVRLKSGGVIMTVNGFDQIISLGSNDSNNYQQVVCVWHDKNKPFHRIYHVDTLEKIS